MANELAEIKASVFDKVTTAVRRDLDDGRLMLPPNYSPDNAISSAWLKLQECTDSNRKPVLSSCTKASIINALLSMVYQGLNPDKNQCYFIAYANKLVLQRSYFGSMHVAQLMDKSITNIYYDVVYADDEFEYSKTHGRTVITKHNQKLSNINKNSIIAAYCTIMRGDDEDTTIMTMDEIKAAWGKSRVAPVDAGGKIKANSTHGQFTKDMAIKTVVNHACKYIINRSDDSSLFGEEAKASADELQSAEEIAEKEISDNANTIEIEIEDAEISEPQSEEEAEIVSDADVVAGAGEPEATEVIDDEGF